MAPRPKQTQPPSPPITLPPPGSAKKGGTVAPVGSIPPPVILPPPGSANKSKTTTIPSIGATTKVPGTNQTTNLSDLEQAELVEIYRKANAALANAQRFGVPEETAQEILDTGKRPDTGFATWIPGIKATGGFLKKAAGTVLPDFLDVSFAT